MLPHHLKFALFGLLAVLVAGTVIIGLKAWLRPSAGDKELWLRMRSWWLIAALFVGAILLNKAVAAVFFAAVSFLALKEFFSLIQTRNANRKLMFWMYLAIPVQYTWVWMGWYGLFIVFIPVYMFIFMHLYMIKQGETKDFLTTAGTHYWGLMVTVFCLSHAAYLLVLPNQKYPAANSADLLLFLIFLTQFNDVMQFVWGKIFGNYFGGYKITPTISPNKTLVGLLGGVATTVLSAWLLAPYLTPLLGWQALLAGLIIGLGGFVGDVTISALKRDIGVKDTGNLIPGHGGVLDRVDSLTVTAPLFFHFFYYLHF